MQTALEAARKRAVWNQDVVDALLAVGLAAFVLTVSILHGVRLDALAVALLLGQTLPLVARNRNPGLVLLICGLSIGVYSGLRYTEVGGNVGVLVAFYSVAVNKPRRHAAFAAALCGVGVLLTLVNYAATEPAAMQQVFSVYLEYVIAWLVGDYLRVRRAYTRELEERAIRLERDREEEAKVAVGQERARIARELHDVVAHHVSVMVIQAAGARRVAETDPRAARDALIAVEAAGRTALAEMRRMLEVLRSEDAGIEPQPSLDGLDRLIDQVRASGLPVELAIEGAQCCLPAGMDLAAYRIVQEALTNTVKHAGKASAKVTVRYAPSTLEIEVTDDGRGAAAPLLNGDSGGHGLIGMRERVQLYGGELETGPIFPGGFRVLARMPLDRREIARATAGRESESALAAVAEAAVRSRIDLGPIKHGNEPGGGHSSTGPNEAKPERAAQPAAPAVHAAADDPPAVHPPTAGGLVPPHVSAAAAAARRRHGGTGS